MDSKFATITPIMSPKNNTLRTKIEFRADKISINKKLENLKLKKLKLSHKIEIEALKLYLIRL